MAVSESKEFQCVTNMVWAILKCLNAKRLLQIICLPLPFSHWQSRMCSPGFLSVNLPPSLPLLFSGWTLQLCVRSWSPYHQHRHIQLSISTHRDAHKHSVGDSHSQHLSPSNTNTHAQKYPSPLINGRVGEGARQGGKALEERGEEEREAAAAVVLESVSAPPCCPLSISSLAPPGTHALARPQEPGSQDQAKGEKKGNKRGKEGYHKRKRKTELT